MTHSELLAWAAGFVDGEGCISLYERKDRKTGYYIKLHVANTNKASLERLQALFGGSIQYIQRGSPERNWKPSFAWIVSHVKAHNALVELLPYLFVKKKQAELAVQARESVGPVGVAVTDEHRTKLNSLLQEFRSLNMKGWVAISLT